MHRSQNIKGVLQVTRPVRGVSCSGESLETNRDRAGRKINRTVVGVVTNANPRIIKVVNEERFSSVTTSNCYFSLPTPVKHVVPVNMDVPLLNKKRLRSMD